MTYRSCTHRVMYMYMYTSFQYIGSWCMEGYAGGGGGGVRVVTLR